MTRSPFSSRSGNLFIGQPYYPGGARPPAVLTPPPPEIAAPSNNPTRRAIMLLSYHMPIDGENTMAAPDLATLSAKFQISIPKAVRTAQQWRVGQVFAFIPKGEGMLLVPVPQREDLTGLVKHAKVDDYRDRTDRI